MVIDCPLLEQASEPCGRYLRERDRIIEPLTDIKFEPPPFKVIQERSPQPFAEPDRRLHSVIVMQQVILCEALKFRPENAHAMGSGVQSHRAVSGDCKTMPKSRLKQ